MRALLIVGAAPCQLLAHHAQPEHAFPGTAGQSSQINLAGESTHEEALGDPDGNIVPAASG